MKFIIFLIVSLSPISLFCQWQQLDSKTTIVSVFAFKSSLVVGTKNGIYRSTDNGENWVQTLPKKTITTFLIHDSTLFASSLGTLIYLSTDEGLTWNKISKFGGDAYSLINYDSLIFSALFNNGINKSTDDGLTWVKSDSGLSIEHVYALATLSGDIIAGGYGGIFRSSDTGRSWEPSGLSGKTIFCFRADTQSSVLFAGLYEDGIHRSTDNGHTWVKLENELSASTIFAIDREGDKLIVASDSGIFISLDSGMRWTRLLSESTSCVAFNDQYLFVGAPEGFWRLPFSQLAVKESLQTHRTQSYVECYPNPFSSSTTVHYDNPDYNFVSLKIYNTLGQEVATLVQGQIVKGIYDVRWDAINLPKGLYYCRLNAGSIAETKTIIVQ